MSLVEHEKGYELLEESRKKRKEWRSYTNVDTYEGIRFHLFIVPSLGKIYLTAYSLHPGYKNIEVLPISLETGKVVGFNPQVGLLFSGIEKRNLRILSKKIEKVRRKKFPNYHQLVKILKKYLKVDESKLEEIINLNAQKVLQKYVNLA